ncbi:MAG: NAD-dependent epimerase/dehydratase family protein, partial [Rhodospirillaceae bacterium]|nr:NAD-dependent epimerase/dehydratase family protein [Rhodospirillaceae bacterium]
EGTRNLMRAAGEAGGGRIVYTSSVAVLGLHKDGTPADEDVPVSLEDMTGHYKRSKYLAEEVVRGMVVKDGLPAVIVNPSTPIGARDIKPTPTGRIIVDFVNGRMPAYVDTGLNLVHVDDCARGHLLAYERGKIGERYILGGEDLTLREILLALGRITGRPAPGVRLPNRLLVPFAYGVEGWARLSGMEPRLTVDSLRMARKYMFFSSEKAKRELGFSSRSAEAALSDAVAWFSANNYFKSAVSAASQSR